MLPVFGSVASVDDRAAAPAVPRARRSAKPGSNTTASCAVPRLEQRLERRRRRGTTATIRKTPARAKRARSASVAESGAGSTIARRT